MAPRAHTLRGGGRQAAPADARLMRAANEAKAADERGDVWAANDWWDRHRLIEDSGKDPFELLARGVALNRAAAAFYEAGAVARR